MLQPEQKDSDLQPSDKETNDRKLSFSPTSIIIPQNTRLIADVGNSMQNVEQEESDCTPNHDMSIYLADRSPTKTISAIEFEDRSVQSRENENEND